MASLFELASLDFSHYLRQESELTLETLIPAHVWARYREHTVCSRWPRESPRGQPERGQKRTIGWQLFRWLVSGW